MAAGLAHPYLFFSSNDIPGFKEKLKHPWMARKWKLFLRLADGILAEDEMLPEPPENGTEAHYTPAGGAFAVRVRLLSFLWLMSGERRYLDRAKQHLLHVCGWRRWCGLGLDGRVQPTIDAGIFGSAAATAYDWLHAELSEGERSKVRGALMDFVARPICRKYLVDDRREMTGLEINWPAQWFEAVGLIGCVLKDEAAESSDWIKHAEDVFRALLFYYNDHDGGGHEGVGYTEYMALNAALFSEALRRVTGTSLLESPFLSNLRHFILQVSHMRDGGMWRVNFNDTPRADGTPAHQVSRYIKYQGTVADGPLVLYLAREYRDRQCMWLYGKNLDNLESQAGVFAENWNSPFEVIWFDPDVKPEPPDQLPLSRHFRGVGWIVRRSGWKQSDTFFAFKSGRTAWWHVHNDKNHFILWANGERLIIDPGIGPYLFNPEDVQRMEEISNFYRNTGHNILLVDGQGQLSDGSTWDFHHYGPEAGRMESIEQGGRILDFIDAGFGFHLRADGTRPYYGRLRRWHRSVFSAGLRYLLVLDEVECNGARDLEWTLHMPKGLKLSGNDAVLVSRGKEVMTVTLLCTDGLTVRKKEGFDEGLIWIPPEEKLEGDPLNMVPRAEFLSLESGKKREGMNVLCAIDVHKDGRRVTEALEVIQDANISGARIRENGVYSTALFRTGPGLMKHEGLVTDATFAFLSPWKQPARILASECEAFELAHIRYLQSSRPISMGLEYGGSGMTGTISALTTTDVEVFIPQAPAKIVVGGENVEFGYDSKTRTASFRVRRGTFGITAS